MDVIRSDGGLLDAFNTKARKAVRTIELNGGAVAAFFHVENNRAIDNILRCLHDPKKRAYVQEQCEKINLAPPKVFTSNNLSISQEEKYRRDLQTFLEEVHDQYVAACDKNCIDTLKDCFAKVGSKGTGSSFVTKAIERLGLFHHEIARSTIELLPWITKAAAACQVPSFEDSTKSVKIDSPQWWREQMHKWTPQEVKTCLEKAIQNYGPEKVPNLLKQMQQWSAEKMQDWLKKAQKWSTEEMQKWLPEPMQRCLRHPEEVQKQPSKEEKAWLWSQGVVNDLVSQYNALMKAHESIGDPLGRLITAFAIANKPLQSQDRYITNCAEPMAVEWIQQTGGALVGVAYDRASGKIKPPCKNCREWIFKGGKHANLGFTIKGMIVGKNSQELRFVSHIGEL